MTKEHNLDWLLKYEKHWYLNHITNWLNMYSIPLCHSKNNPVKITIRYFK